MKIIITGGAGYIGSNVALYLMDSGHDVTIIDDLSTGNKNLIPPNANFFQCNINNFQKIDEIFRNEKFSALMHFAGFIEVEESVANPEKYFKNNFENSIKLFEICAKNNLLNIIFSSTAAVYGDVKTDGLISEKIIPKPINPYGESKHNVEKYLLNNNDKFKSIILRYFNVAGADAKLRSGLISKKATHLVKIASEAAVGKREDVTIYGNDYKTSDGTAIRDYIHVSDLAEIHLKSLELLIKKQETLVMNCGYGVGYSVKEVLDKFNEISKNKIKVKYGNRRSGDSAMLVSDISKINKMINWTPKYNNLDYIIKTSIEWEEKLKNEKFS